MSTTDTTPPPVAVAGAFLERLAAGDFAGLAGALEDQIALHALLPGGYREWTGAADVCSRFHTWFGDVAEYGVLDSSVGLVGPRVQMRWRVRVCDARFGGERIVEQIAFADPGPTGRIGTMSLLCSGYTEALGDD